MHRLNTAKSTWTLLLLSAVFLFWNCSNRADLPAANNRESDAVSQREVAMPKVRITKAEKKVFRQNIWTNGKLRAVRSLEIKAGIKGKLSELLIDEGDEVKEGQLLLRFDDAAWQLQKKQAQIAVEEALYKKNDLLVMQGGEWGIDSSVNKQTFDNILIESNLKKAWLNLEQIEHQHQFYEIRAPFSGVIANLKIKPLQELEAGAPMFTIYDPGSMQAELQLMETELMQIHKGQSVKIFPTGLDSTGIPARLSSINPVVNEHGLVKVSARPSNSPILRKMFLPDGLAVKAAIEKLIPGQLVIPRSAVVFRSEKPVVFTWDANSGLAKWHYVTIAHEAQDIVAIAGGLDAGAWVIYEGNLNLDHDAAVSVVNLPNPNSQ